MAMNKDELRLWWVVAVPPSLEAVSRLPETPSMTPTILPLASLRSGAAAGCRAMGLGKRVCATVHFVLNERWRRSDGRHAYVDWSKFPA